ncbi:CNNM domain-containing protein [Tenacibaculum sp. HL-MS23]|uniref:CNNM domain-containing protein n=1 Tax=Tenacibaculum TaxID=104267 RepID=UPI001C4EDC5D|nr:MULTISPECIES: CNNM domain-containing protein [Tenacibaculum]QXP73392.1 DUF21 domain-containing protein [Tenacibaculum sp. AHE14PA]QXP74906.1 DUF21 domain-containing protein [Tenacibaculum sp. AHE15PA]WNW01443.1 CNNM domain-containing protein [Tenacibaculum sp. HL-MS23]
MTLLLIYATVSIFFSFICSILEAVLLSVTPTFVNVKKKEGVGFATQLEALKKDVDKPLIAILTLNTLAHTVGAILVGTEAKKIFNDDGYGVFIVSAAMTILILVASEIIPKTIGATYWKQLASFTTTALKVMIFPLKWTGILWILQLTTKLIGGKGGHGESILSREDFTAMTDIAEQEGVFQQNESNVIRNMLNFKDIQAKHIMTPRTVIKIADENESIESFFENNKLLNFSRIPVFSKNPDNITGYILKDQLLLALIDKKGAEPLKSIKRDIIIADRDLSIPGLFKKLIEQREHLALIVDEYGSVSGLITQEDVIETLLGYEIMDESDNVANLQSLARKNWKKRLGIINDLEKK